jgi:hypothetical protein
VAASRPAPSDEGLHAPGPEPLWSESWYFDAIADGGDLGVYHRLGRLPNTGACLLTTCVVRPGQPALMLVASELEPPPADDPAQEIAAERVRARHACERTLEHFRITVEGSAEAHADHSAPLRGLAGEPVEIALDAVWTTDGIPYRWRRATRYEIPCRVAGTVRVGERRLELSGPGQRDHSWGARDWWASDWMWCALHFADGTHAHAVTVPGHPNFAAGYVQRDGELLEAASATSSEVVTREGLIESARVAISPGELEVEVEPVAFGALLLESGDGRVSHFPRAMARLRATDGRVGLGWLEWNRNQR